MLTGVVMNELVRLLEGYLMSSTGLGECAEWLAGVDWDDPALTQEERESLGQFELLLTEIAEGLREESEFRESADDFVSYRTDIVSSR